MHNYNSLEKTLHKVALSSRFIREITFDIESLLFPSKNLIENHVFISGLARSGTTILLNALYKSDMYASLTYADMPFIMAPNLWSKLTTKKNIYEFKERKHLDGIKFSINSPEAFEEVFWKTFQDNKLDSFHKFNIFTNNIMNKYKKKRYISKNNQNIKRITKISNALPSSKVLIPFRNPVQHAYSLLSQHKRFIKLSNKDQFISTYMKLIGHTEFGCNYYPFYKKNLNFRNDWDINHWVEQWYLIYSNFYKNLLNKKKHEIYLL